MTTQLAGEKQILHKFDHERLHGQGGIGRLDAFPENDAHCAFGSRVDDLMDGQNACLNIVGEYGVGHHGVDVTTSDDFMINRGRILHELDVQRVAMFDG